MNKPHLCSIERLFDLLTHSDMTRKQFCEKWDALDDTKDYVYLSNIVRIRE